jgi:hypothetical protein
MTRGGRVLAVLITGIAIASILGQGYVFIDMVAARGGRLIHVVWVMLGFFTILTNLLIALVCLSLAQGPWPAWWPAKDVTLGCLATNIVMVAIIYHLLLSHLWNPQGLHYASDQGLHTVVPLLFVALWVFHAPKSGLRWSHALWWLLYPAGYFAYALARGALDGWYPYPFIEVPKLGYAQVLLNAAGISVVLALGGLALIAFAKRITARA